MKDELLRVALRVAQRMREEGVQIGTSEVVDGLRIAENLAMLEGQEPNLDHLHDALKAVFSRDSRSEELFEKIWRDVTGQSQSLSRVMAAVEEDLRRLGVSWGSRIYSKRRLLSGPHADEKREAYSRLRLLGLIVRTSRGDVVLDREAALRRLRSLLRRYGSAWDALADSAARMISRGRLEWYALYAAPVDEERLASVELDRVASAGLQALQEGNRGLARKLAAIVSKRLEAGEAPRDSWSAFRLLREMGELTSRSLASLLHSEPRIVDEMLRSRESREMLAEALRLMDADSLRPILRRLVKDRRGLSIAAGLVGEVDLSAWRDVKFTRTPRTQEEALIYVVSSLAKAEHHLLNAAGGDEAQLDMAYYELSRASKIDESMLPEWAVPAVEAYRERVERLLEVLNGDVDVYVKLSTLVHTMEPEEALLYLRRVYRSGDEDVKRAALRLAELVWRRLEARAARLYRVKGDKRRDAHGRIDIRKTIYNLVSYRENPIVAYRRRSKPSFALVLDTSGSMAKYSLWALLAASAFSKLVSSITLFSSNVSIVSSASRLTARRIIELLFNTSFEGYTNISAALRETARLYRTPTRMLVVTDLCQTVEDEKPEDVTERLARRGWRIYYLLPPRHCTAARERVAPHATTRIVSKPEELPRLIPRLI